MAQFEGTIEEFMRFIGPHARIMVWNITQKHRKNIGMCEECGSTTKLEAAHVKGKERPLLIANILSQFREDEVIRIDLREFEERFIETHLPIESTIRILCNSCHKKYDSLNLINEIAAESTDVYHSDRNSVEESKIIEKLINQQQMNKAKALQIVRGKGLFKLTNANTIFSNVTLPDTWWLQPSNDKFQSLLHIILNLEKSSKLYVFAIQANAILNPAQHFKQRNDSYSTNCSDIYIPTSGLSFKEKNGFDFGKFLIETIVY